MFFGLTEHNGRALSDEPPGQRAWRRDIEVHPLFIRWVDGFYNAEQGPGGPFRWCSRSGTIEIDNDSRAFRRAVISMTIIAGAPSSVLRIAGDLMSEQIEITSGGTHVSRSLGFSPGRHVIRFRSDGPPADVPSDPRDLIWRAESVALEESAPP
jgi:hypothetical protein